MGHVCFPLLGISSTLRIIFFNWACDEDQWCNMDSKEIMAQCQIGLRKVMGKVHVIRIEPSQLRIQTLYVNTFSSHTNPVYGLSYRATPHKSVEWSNVSSRFHPVFIFNFGGISILESPDKRWCWGVCYQDARRFRFGIGVSWHCAFHASDAIVYKAIPFETHCLSHDERNPMVIPYPMINLYIYIFYIHLNCIGFVLKKAFPTSNGPPKLIPKVQCCLAKCCQLTGWRNH